MDKNIADKLWELANKFQGALGMPEACRLIICALFFKHIDMEKKRVGDTALESYDERFSVKYLALTYGELVEPNDVAEYMKKMEPDFNIKDGIVSSEMEDLLGKVGNEYVQMVFRYIREIKFDSSSQMYDVAASLLDRLPYVYGNAKGQVFANLSLCRLEGRMLNCQEGMRVYDGFCGCGLSVSEAAGSRGIVYMQDMERESVAIAAVMALLKGNRIGTVECGDSLVNPLEEVAQYDRIICEPPFMSKYADGYLSSVQESNCIVSGIADGPGLALGHVLARMGENGTAVVLVPTGMLFKSGKGAKVRESLADAGYIDAVIELPAGVVPNTWTATALLVLRKSRESNAVYMLNAKDFFEKEDKKQLVISEENIGKLVGMYEKREEVEGVAHNVAQKLIIDNEYNLCTSQYVISNPQNSIKVGNIAEYLQKYEQLAGQLSEIDRQLEAVRGRFVGKA